MTHRIFLAIAVVILVGFPDSARSASSDPITVAVISHEPNEIFADMEQTFREELIALTEGEFDIRFKEIVTDWSAAATRDAFDAAYADPDVDLVLGIGFLANQLGVSRGSFPKPTFLPLVINTELLGAPLRGNSSGTTNLSYLVDAVPFREDLSTFRRLVPFQRLLLVTDEAILESLRDAPEVARQEAPGVTFEFLGHRGGAHDLLSAIPPDTDIVVVGGLPRMTRNQLRQFYTDGAERGFAMFAMDLTDVELGALASDAIETSDQRIARRNALNMQAVLLGERAEDQAVFFVGKRQLTINLQTADTIGISPSFDILSEANTIGEPANDGPTLDLLAVAQTAARQNLDLEVSRIDTDIGAEEVNQARAALFPRLSLGTSYLVRDITPTVASGAFPEKSTDGSVTLSQSIYSDSIRSQHRQAQLFQESRIAGLEAATLDAIFDATLAYLQLLRAETQLQIQQDNLRLNQTNLDLAEDRVRVGTANNSDVFRWESNLAAARSAVLAGLAGVEQARENLNRILNRPLASAFTPAPVNPQDPFSMTEAEFNTLVNNPRQYARFTDFNVAVGLENAPELAQLRAQSAAAKRDIESKKRAYWLPEFGLQAQYTDNLDMSGVGAGGPGDGLSDWNVAISASLPLFQGGARRADLARSRLLHRQLQVQLAATEQRIGQGIRSAMHAAQASYASIDLFDSSTEAARQNLVLVADAYRLGTVSIVELLDAQNQSLQAELSANNAVHDFLIDVMNLQRSLSQFEFMLPQAEQDALNERIRAHLGSTAN